MTDDGMTEDPNGVTGGSTCKCGLEGERRIVGGEDSTSGKYPWIVSLNAGPAFGSDSHMHNCGGTLVASNWVVTAAHCIVDAGTPKKTTSPCFLELLTLPMMTTRGGKTLPWRSTPSCTRTTTTRTNCQTTSRC